MNRFLFNIPYSDGPSLDDVFSGCMLRKDDLIFMSNGFLGTLMPASSAEYAALEIWAEDENYLKNFRLN